MPLLVGALAQLFPGFVSICVDNDLNERKKQLSNFAETPFGNAVNPLPVSLYPNQPDSGHQESNKAVLTVAPFTKSKPKVSAHWPGQNHQLIEWQLQPKPTPVALRDISHVISLSQSSPRQRSDPCGQNPNKFTIY